MNPSYLAKNFEELYEKAPTDVLQLVEGGEVDQTTATLGKIYKLPINSYVALSNVITFLLIGAIAPENAVRALVDIVGAAEGDALKIAADLDKSILEKARIKILGKAPTDMVELTFQEGRSPDELRKEILDTTKRESAMIKEQVSLPATNTAAAATPAVPPSAPAETQKKVMAASGSRSQLLEQLQVLDSIPDDDEVTARLSKIKEQITSMEGKMEEGPSPAIPLRHFMPGERDDSAIEPESKSASYSKAPTKYNVDPYREPTEI